MSLSPRQVELVQGAAAVLMRRFQLTKDEAIGVIAAALRKECLEKQITLEAMDIRPRGERAAFVRGVVKHVQDWIEEQKLWSKEKVASAISQFMHVLHDSWMHEN